MKARSASSNTFNSITPFCQDKKPLHVKVAILSIQIISFSDQMGAIILFLEYLQLMSQIFLLNSNFSTGTGITSSNALSEAILLIMKVLTPSQLIIFEGMALNSCIVIMSALTFIFLLKSILFVYIVVIAAKDSKENAMCIKIWAFTVKTHTRVGYYIWTSFWTRLIFLFSENKVDGAENSLWVIWCLILIILEFSFVVIIQMVSSYFLPTLDFLSSKNNQSEITVLIQKITMQILEFSPIPHTDALLWTITFINILFCLVRDVLFFRTLPLYRIKALLYQLQLSITTTCLSVTYLVSIFLKSVGSGMEIDINFVIVIWSILALMTIKVALSYLDQVLYNLVTKSNKNYSAEILLHKTIVITELLNVNSEISHLDSKYRWSYLLNKSCKTSIHQTLNLTDKSDIKLDQDPNSKEYLNQLFILYLEELSQKFPKNNIVKLYLAYYYAKIQKLYGLSMTVLVSLRNLSPSIITQLNISLLIHKMQMKLIAEQRMEGVSLDIYSYIKCVSFVDSLKESMLKQGQLQINLCNEVIQSTPSLSSILTSSQKISKQRFAIETKIKETFRLVPEYFVEPLKLIAHYQLILNHSTELYERYTKEYNTKSRKYDQFFSQKGLCQENIFDKNNVVLVISGRKENLTTIVYRNAPTFEVYGRDTLGDKCYTVGHPALQKFFQQSFQISLERGDGRISRQILQAYQYNSHAGWAAPCDFYIDISPFLSQDLYYFALIKMHKSYNELIILNEDGTIDCCTKKIGLEVGSLPLPANATKNTTHISLISKELDQMNQAFNMIAFPEKYRPGIDENNKEDDLCSVVSRFTHPIKSSSSHAKSGFSHFTINLSAVQAQDMFSLYTTEGQTVRLQSIKRPGKSFLYNCKVQQQLFDSVLIKLIFLEKTDNYDNYDEYENEDVISNTTDNDLITSERYNIKTNVNEKPKTLAKPTDEDEENYLSEDEKRDGWIDFNRLTSFNSPLESHPPADEVYRDDKIKPSCQDTLSSARKLLTTRSQFRLETKSGFVRKDEKHETAKKIEKKEELEKSLLTSNILNPTKSAKISKAFKEALNTKYYPKFYIIFLVLWYTLLTAIMANQIRLSVEDADKMEKILDNKNLLRMSSGRTDHLISAHLHLRSLWKLVDTDASFDTDYLLNYLANEFTDLREANSKLILATGNGIKENRIAWFKNDIRVYEDSLSEYTYRNNFQAVDAIVVAGFTSITKARVNIYESMPAVEFVLRNSLNDLLIKTNVISDKILSDLYENTQVSLNALDINLWVTMSVIILMASYFAIMAYVQFKEETTNLLAFTKLSNKAVENVMNQVTLFKNIIEKDLDFDEIHRKKHKDYYTKNSSYRKANQNNSQGYKGVSRKFFCYGLQTYFLLLVITVIITISHMMSSDSLTNTQRLFFQLHFSDDMNQKVSLALTTLFEIMSNPNATNITYVQDNPIMTDIQNQIQDISNQITKIPLQFTQEDFSSDPMLEEIMFEDSCRYIEVKLFKSLCQRLQTGASKNGIIQYLSDLELYLQNTLAQSAIHSIADQLVAIRRDLASRAMFSTLSEVLNEHFDQTIIDSIAASHWFNTVIIVSLLFVCIVVHVFVLRRLGESDNDFKRVLQTFPAFAIVSNFMLKSFLLKTSKETLNAIRNEI